MPTPEPTTGSLPAGLRCPSCHANIAADAGESLVCTGCGTKYPVVGGVPVLINTSFNTRGEPIVCTPRDAVESFWTSPLDALIIGSFALEKPGGNGIVHAG